MTEEYYGGEGFYRWFSRLAGVRFSAQDFLRLNAVAWCVMILAIGLVAVFPSCRFLLAVFAGVVLLNSLLHLSFSIWTHSYSPGAVSGVLCWMPLGIYTLRREWHELPHAVFGLTLVVSIGLHALISFAAMHP
jgi:hypothetical protein